MDWDEAIEEAKKELGIYGYTNNWDEIVKRAKDIIKEYNRCENAEYYLNLKEDYKEYLKTDRWKRLRYEALFRDNFKCLDCGEPAIEVHHTSYDYLNTDEEINFLMSLCRECHYKRTITQKKITNGIRLNYDTRCNYCSEKAVIILRKTPVCRKHWKDVTEGKIIC